ncbi:SDR family NAD(P)-dependent oxidoreductase [Actinoplanes sp. NPDC048796]|uniref:SDR family NAD(P)-dependent oxidoreductase n=1 Tax=unclassified Actinoplanes TaxID=2626549 RepID=UPI0033C62FDB
MSVVVMYGCGDDTDTSIIRTFAARGARVVLTGGDSEAVERLAHEAPAAAGAVTTVQVDPYDAAAVDRHLASVIRSAGQVDVCCSFVAVPTSISSVPVAVPGSVRPTFVPPYFLPARLAANHMIAHGSGAILVVSDRAGHDADAIEPAWVVKQALVRNLAEECEPHNVVVVDLPAPVTADAVTSWWPAFSR